MTRELLEQVLSITERSVSMADEMINTNTNNRLSGQSPPKYNALVNHNTHNRWGRVII